MAKPSTVYRIESRKGEIRLQVLGSQKDSFTLTGFDDEGLVKITASPTYRDLFKHIPGFFEEGSNFFEKSSFYLGFPEWDIRGIKVIFGKAEAVFLLGQTITRNQVQKALRKPRR